MAPRIAGIEVLDDRRLGEGGFLTIRRLRLRMIREDGSHSGEGIYDYVERPKGLDAVVLALYSRGSHGSLGSRGSSGNSGVEVLVRDGLRVPLQFGRPGEGPARASGALRLHTELVAGIVETGEEDEASLRSRAAAEAYEEAGLTVSPDAITLIGAPTFPTPGMCAELFFLAACEVPAEARALACVPPGDGSPFEEGALLRWLDLDAAIDACVRGEICDMKTELLLRRLRDHLASR